jgi:hypothetical protein
MCSRCKNKYWHCLGCNNKITHMDFNNTFKDNSQSIVAVYCDCCDHNFVCKRCYDKNPGYAYWKSVFGNSHSVYDLISKENDLGNTLLNIVKGNKLENINQANKQIEKQIAYYSTANKILFTFIIVCAIIFITK